MHVSKRVEEMGGTGESVAAVAACQVYACSRGSTTHICSSLSHISAQKIGTTCEGGVMTCRVVSTP